MNTLKHKLLVVLSIGLFAAGLIVVSPSRGFAVCADADCGDSTVDYSCAEWNGYGGTGTKLPDDYKSSKCDSSDGGPCHVTTSTEGGQKEFHIACPTPPSGDPGSGTTGGDVTSSIKDNREKNECDAANLTKTCGTVALITALTNIAAGVAAAVIVGSIILAGIQYSMAGADPNKVQAAKHRMTSAILALVFLIFGFSILQWLIPGGIF